MRYKDQTGLHEAEYESRHSHDLYTSGSMWGVPHQCEQRNNRPTTRDQKLTRTVRNQSASDARPDKPLPQNRSVFVSKNTNFAEFGRFGTLYFLDLRSQKKHLKIPRGFSPVTKGYKVGFAQKRSFEQK